MDSLIVILAIIGVVSKLMKKSNAVKKNAPGQKKPMPTPQMTPAQPAQPITQPVQPAFWDKLSEALGETLEETKKAIEPLLKENGPKPAAMDEGESRQCEQGSIGGSMEHGVHQGFTEAEAAKETLRAAATPKPAVVEPAPAALCSVTRLTAEDMRRAVIMSEILTRPSERWARRGNR